MKKLSNKVLVLSAVGLGAVVLTANAASGIAERMMSDDHFGGKAKHIEWMVGQIDDNGDGMITRPEVAAYQDQRFVLMDSDADGELTPKELSEGARTLIFQRMDVDADGFVSEAEFLEVSAGMGHAGKGVRRMDADGNGRVAAAEMSQQLDKLFNRLDKDEDGIVNAEELDRVRKWGHRH